MGKSIIHFLKGGVRYRLLLSCLMLLAVQTALAVTVDGIEYSINTSTQKAIVAQQTSLSKSNVVIPEAITYNGVDYPVTSISDNAFDCCSRLRSLTIPNSVTYIGSSAFSGCSRLRSLTIPNSVTSIGDYAFYGCSGLTSMTIGNSVTRIGSFAFYGCSGLTSMTIGNSVTRIGLYAFYGCSGLTSLTIPNSVTNIGSSAFYGCSGLTSMTIGNSVTYIGSSAFFGCSGLRSLTIPNSVTNIDSYTFSGCSGLTSLTIPNSVTSIGNYAFDNCSSLKELRFEDGESTLILGYNSYSSYYTGNGLFYHCPLETLYLGRNLSYNTGRSYGYSPFYGKKTLTSLTIPNSVTRIGSYAFYGCSGLTSLTIPNSVTNIGSSAFYGCSGLTSVTIPNSVTSIGSDAFRGCSGLTSVTIPNSVTNINYSVFHGCSSLESVNIPDGVTSIGASAFNGTALSEVILPASVTEIEESAFANCKNIAKVYSLNTTPPVTSSSTFDTATEETATLYVRKGALVYYWLDPVWKEFKNMVDDILCLDAIPDATYGDGEIDLAQYAPEGVELTYETSNDDVVRINGTMMTIVGAGEATVSAMIADEGAPLELIGQMRQFNVKQADLVVSVADVTVAEGEEIPDFNLLFDGLVYDDTPDDIEMLPVACCDAAAGSPAGEYPIYFSEGHDRNYKITTVAGKLTIAPKKVLCLDAIPDATYGDGEIDLAQYAPEGVELTYETSNDDVVRINGTMMTIVGAGEATVSAMIADGGAPMDLIGQMRQFNVKQADLVVSVADLTIAEGEEIPAFNLLFDGLVYDDTPDDIEMLPVACCDAAAGSPAGEYPIYFSEGHDRNYRITTVAGKLTIAEVSTIENVVTDADEQDIEVFDMGGILVYVGPRKQARLRTGFYLVRQGRLVTKIYVK